MKKRMYLEFQVFGTRSLRVPTSWSPPSSCLSTFGQIMELIIVDLHCAGRNFDAFSRFQAMLDRFDMSEAVVNDLWGDASFLDTIVPNTT